MTADTHSDCIRLVLDFLAYCKNATGGEDRLETSFSSEFPTELAERWQKIREPNYFFNKGQLRVLSYFVKEPKSKVVFYNSTFHDLKFDFSEREVSEVARVTNQMAVSDTRSFCFLSGYLLKCCYQMEEQGKSLEEIE
jgi:hypothetical protein